MSDGPLGSPPVAVTAGIEIIAAELEAQGVDVTRVDWRPPAPGGALCGLAVRAPRTAAANDSAVARLQAARPVVVGIETAGEAIPALGPGVLLHAGPPIEWDRMCGPMRGAVIGALLYEGDATSSEDAERMAAGGDVELRPCHDHGAVGPMAGVVSRSMPMWVIENGEAGNRAYATLNEGLGRVLRYGAYDDEVLTRLRWMREALAPALARALERTEPGIDLRALIAQALQMGDEAHNRNRAATSLLLRALAPALASDGGEDAVEALRFIDGNDHFFLNLAMAAAKATADAASGVAGSSVVTAMARNGVEFGIRLSGTGARWFTGPAGEIDGLFFTGYGPEDANPDIGDSSITETVGLGGFSMAAAPAIVRFVGGSAELALETSRRMYEITWSESEAFQLPALGFRGAPLGIDARAVVQTGIAPTINTGIAHREPGVGQVGAGLVAPPMAAFSSAVEALAEEDRR
jgi:hypothetical protein